MIKLGNDAGNEPAAWRSIVGRIRAGDRAACEELYSTAFQDVRSWFRRLGDPLAEDRTHDTYLVTIHAIMKGGPRNPECLPGFIRVIAHRQFCSSLRIRQRRSRDVATEDCRILDPKPDLDSQIIVRQRRECVQEALRDLPADQRDVLERFYVQEQDPKQICAEMILSETQFRLLKWRAKTRFTAILQKRLRGQALASLARRSVVSAF